MNVDEVIQFIREAVLYIVLIALGLITLGRISMRKPPATIFAIVDDSGKKPTLVSAVMKEDLVGMGEIALVGTYELVKVERVSAAKALQIVGKPRK